jgi:hypothetical protein
MPELTLPIRQRGVLVKVLLRRGPLQPRDSQAIHHAARPVKSLTAYLDTGASNTVLDMDIIRSMNLRPERTVALYVLGREDVSFHETYDVEIALVQPGEPECWRSLVVVGGSVYPTGAVVALGRDFLQHLVITYDGPGKQALLQW